MSITNYVLFIIQLGVVRGGKSIQQVGTPVHERPGQRTDRDPESAGQQSTPGPADHL